MNNGMTGSGTVCFLLLFLPTYGITQTVRSNSFWLAYYSTIPINQRWSISSDVQVRTKEWTTDLVTRLVRTGLSYKLNEKTIVTAGFAFFQQAQSVGSSTLFKNEWRPWQEITLINKWNKLSATQRVRAEQRNLQQVKNGKLSTDYDFVFRLRYRFEFQHPIMQNLFNVSIGNEVLVNPGHIGEGNFFDQNRVFAGVSWKASKTLNIQAQYISIHQQRANANSFQQTGVARLSFMHKFFLKGEGDGHGKK